MAGISVGGGEHIYRGGGVVGSRGEGILGRGEVDTRAACRPLGASECHALGEAPAAPLAALLQLCSCSSSSLL